MEEMIGGHIAPRAMKAYIDKRMTPYLAPYGIPASYGQYLKAVSLCPGASLKDIATAMLVDKAITTRTLRILIEKGFVYDESDSERQYSLGLTVKGEEVLKVINKAMLVIWDDILVDLTEEERKMFPIIAVKVNNRINLEFKEMYE